MPASKRDDINDARHQLQSELPVLKAQMDRANSVFRDCYEVEAGSEDGATVYLAGLDEPVRQLDRFVADAMPVTSAPETVGAAAATAARLRDELREARDLFDAREPHSSGRKGSRGRRLADDARTQKLAVVALVDRVLRLLNQCGQTDSSSEQ